VNLRRVFPEVSEPIELGGPASSEALDDLYRLPARHWTRINLVTSVDGSAAGADGTSSSLTAGADRRVLGAIRREADIVLVGAASVRAEGYQLPKIAPLAIVTASGDLSGHAVPRDVDAGRVIVLCTAASAGRARSTLGVPSAEIVELPAVDGVIAAADVLGALRQRGHESIVCEGGPLLASRLLDAGLVDELCLTTTPVLVAGQPSLLSVERHASLELRQLLIDDLGVTFARWAVAR
jgi:riboflavin biosynthesis pyrimidine reductase